MMNTRRKCLSIVERTSETCEKIKLSLRIVLAMKRLYKSLKKINELELKTLKIKEDRDMALLEKFSAKLILKMHLAEYHFNREMIYKMKKSKEESQKN